MFFYTRVYMKIKNIMLSTAFIMSHVYYCIADTTNPVEKLFTQTYRTNGWLSKETVSGIGSEFRFTQKVRNGLSSLIKLLGIQSIADAPCGDVNWIKHMDLGACRYIGIDIVQELIESNIQKFGQTKEFLHLNLIENVIEKVDLIICRDMLAHLTYEQIFAVLRNFKQSGSKYILMTTGVTTKVNNDSGVGGWRPLNFELPPFNFPKPLLLIQEDTPFAWEQGKHLGLWLLEDLNI